MVKIKAIDMKSYAKINLHLGVGSQRDDGFHSLQSIFARISLFDRIHVTIYESESLNVKVTGLDFLKIDGDDSLTKAAKLWCDATGVVASIAIDIKKNIPSEAGLGGGSSNAATVLLALQKMNPSVALPFDELLDIGASIGSDVPFFLFDTTFCYVTGRGEIVKPLYCKFDYRVHIVKPMEGISTKGAFKALDKIDRIDFYKEKDFLDYFKSGIDYWKKYFFNDFEKVIPSQVLKSFKESNNLCMMSGSGSTCYEIINKNGVVTSICEDVEADSIYYFL
jgi:4-diphosphocytidyl-2-C-methyl-D-erythritol kinase